MNDMRRLAIMALVAAGLLAGCGGVSQTITGAGSGTGTGTGGTGGTTTYSMGNGSGAGFQAGIIHLSSANVSAGGTASLRVRTVGHGRGPALDGAGRPAG